MAAIANIASLLDESIIPSGDNGIRVIRGVGTFNSTDASGDLPCPLSVVKGVLFYHIAGQAPAADEVLLAPADLATKPHNVSGNKIVITRTGASPTSGLKFGYVMWGW